MLSSIYRGGAVALLLLLGAFDRGDAARRAGTADPRRCAPPGGLAGLPPDSAAVRCAEWFVARNGYTNLPPLTDSAQLALESIEIGPSLAAVVADRRNTLAPAAAVVCAGGAGGGGDVAYTVGFLAPGSTATDVGRAVTMDAAFAELRVQHKSFLLGAALRDTATCHRLAGMPPG